MSTTRPVSVPSPNVVASASRSITMREASSAVALDPAADDHRDLARQHRILAEQRHQTVGELAADERVVAAALGGAERLQLVEQRELRGPRQAPQQVPLEPRHRRRARRSPAETRRPGRAAPRAASARADRRTAAARRRGAAVRADVAAGGGRRRPDRAARSPQRAGVDVGDGLAGRPGDGVDVDQPVGLDDRDRRLATAPGRRRSSTGRPSSGGARRLRDRRARTPGSRPGGRRGPARSGRRRRSGSPCRRARRRCARRRWRPRSQSGAARHRSGG